MGLLLANLDSYVNSNWSIGMCVREALRSSQFYESPRAHAYVLNAVAVLTNNVHTPLGAQVKGLARAA